LLILTPLGMYTKYMAEKERKKALAGSSVKVIGADVMATRKVISTFTLYPIQCFIFTVFVYYYVTPLM